MRRFGTSIFILACVLLGRSGQARGDAVTDWNAIALQTIVSAGAAHSSAVSFLDNATVQVAVYDAVEAYSGRFRPYHAQVRGASGSVVAAVAAAAHDVLVNRFPAQAGALDITYQTYLTNHGLAQNDPGVTIGQQAAAEIIALRANDGSFPLNYPPFTGSNQIGVWRPTPSYLPGPPPAFSPALAPWLAKVTPFALTSPAQYRPQGPPPLGSQQYTTAYNEIKGLGSSANSTRTSEQTDLALFWNTTYAVTWNRALRDIAAARALSLEDSARLLALANLAMADAGITAWDSKFTYVFWRPVTAIQMEKATETRLPRAIRTGSRSSTPLIIPNILPARTT